LEYPAFAVHVEDPVNEEVVLRMSWTAAALAVNTYVWVMPTLRWRM
jgi:hypothetical protein